jgi:hypothetical protein
MSVTEKTRIKRAHDAVGMIDWAVESAVALILWAVLFGNVVYPQWLAVSTSGWNLYAVSIWVLIPFFALAALILRLIDTARAGWQRPFY